MILSVSDLSGFQNFLCASVHIVKFKYDSNTNISNRLSLEQWHHDHEMFIVSSAVCAVDPLE